MKRFFTLFFMIFLTLPVSAQVDSVTQNTDEVYSKPLEIGITFDWISKTQLQRDENIKEVQKILFNEKFETKYDKNEFKGKYKDDWKDTNFVNNYVEIKAGKKEDAQNNYCGFYKWNLFVAYGIQHKNNLRTIYYYDAMGNLRWVEILGGNYPDFPYWSYQYYKNGELAAAYYYLSNYDQYMFDNNKKFIGRAYKEKIYNKNAKVIMIRSNY